MLRVNNGYYESDKCCLSQSTWLVTAKFEERRRKEGFNLGKSAVTIKSEIFHHRVTEDTEKS